MKPPYTRIRPNFKQPDFQAGLIRVGSRRETELPCPVQYLVFEVHGGRFFDASVNPVVAFPTLSEDRHNNAIRSQLLAKDVYVHFKALAQSFGWGEPICDNYAPEGICRRQWHKRKRCQGGAPEIAIDADPTTASAFLSVTAEEGQNTTITRYCIIGEPHRTGVFAVTVFASS